MRLLIPLFSPATGTWGGLTRVIAISSAAQQAGHSVAFCASGYLENTLRQRGYCVYTMPATTMLGLPAPLSRLMERRSQRVSLPIKPGKSFGSIWMVLMLSGLARASYLHRLVDAELAAARDFNADALFTDLDPGALLIAAITGLPLATAYASILSHGIGSWAWRRMRAAIMPVLKAHGKPACQPEDLWFGPTVLKIIPSIPELDGADPSRPDVCYVGHLLGEISADLKGSGRSAGTKDDRYVFVYTGTGSISLDRLRTVLPLVFPAGSRVTCLVGAQSVGQPQRFGAVEFRPYVSAEKVLPYCDWTICHGGQNTIIQSLQHGVPLLIFPGPIFERRFNAQRVQDAGAGLMGEVPDFTMEWLRAAMQRHAVYAAQAKQLGQRICSYGGAPAAVRAMESWSSR